MDYQLQGQVALISIDDGKANALNHNFIDSINPLLDKAEQEASALIIHAREGMFSAGFDLKELQKGGDQAEALIEKGMALSTRLFAFPLPVISACAGHAIGMGAFILLCSDNRLGTNTEYNVTLPETAIGMPFTPVLMSLIHARIPSCHQTTAVLQSRAHSPEEAVTAGFLDQIVEADQLLPQAIALAETLTQLPAEFYKTNKEDLRQGYLKVMRDSLKS
jgi:enoyl-CoA hydratase